MIEQQYPSGRLVKNALDSDGDLATVQSKKNANHAFWNFANHFSYNAAGAMTSMQFGNGRWESTKFNNRLQPTQIALGKTAPIVDAQGQPVYSSELLKLNYEYGELYLGTGNTDFTKNNGNVSKQTITVGSVGATTGFVATQYYAYDSLNRIEIATENIVPDGQPLEFGWRQHFKFDRYGNRNFVTDGATPTTTLGTCPTEVCNPSISPNTNKITSTGYLFDAAGNTTRDAQDRKFTYDAENKQTKVESLSPGTQTVTGTVGEYVYDGDGRRVKKRAYENGVLKEETIFVYEAGGRLIGEYSNQLASSEDAKVAYLTNDHLGSPRINTDINGNVISRHDYHPFGEEVGTSKRVAGLGYAGDSVRKQFTGYQRDDETELDFANARYFGYAIGRFASADNFLNDTHKENPQSWNLYSYVGNNPLKYVDPAGEEFILATITDQKTGKEVDTVSDENKKKLLGWLNHVYGCAACVTVNQDNRIAIDTSKVSTDVLKATKDLTDAINDKSHSVFVVGMEGNSGVNFAAAVRGGIEKDGKKFDAIAIDFKDFRSISGNDAAEASFANYAFVHEAFHLYPKPGLEDTTSSKDQTGPVENKVNEIRYVRGDLLRASYDVTAHSESFGSMYFGQAKVDKKTGGPLRNSKGGIKVESNRILNFNLRMTGQR